MTTEPKSKRSGAATAWRIVAILASLAAVSLTVLSSSRAAFTDTTGNGPNTIASGTVDLRDDDGGSVMFNVGNMAPGDVRTRCIEVTYDGSLPADIRLYGSGSGGLDGYLDMDVDVGTGGDFADCAGFSNPNNIFNNTLSAFRAETNYANGLTGFNGATQGTSRTYRVAFTLQDDNAAQGLSSSVTLTWEAQNT